MDSGALKIDLAPDQVLNIFLRQLRVAAWSLRHTHAAIRRQPAESLPMLDVEGLAFMVEDTALVATPADRLRETEDWLLRAAFIDLITGLNRSLIEGCRIIRIYKMAKASERTFFKSREVLEVHLAGVKAELMKNSIPALIRELQEQIERPLPLKDEISSVNQVRNCLIHGNGIVGRQHLNNKEENVLRLVFIQNEVYVKVNGMQVKVDRALKDQGTMVEGLRTEHHNVSIDYKLEESIILSTDLFNNVAFTCYLFLSELRTAVCDLVGAKPNLVYPGIHLYRKDSASEDDIHD